MGGGKKGIDINSGLVFIPEDAMVNEKTGSRYEMNEKKEAVVNDKYVKLIKEIISSDYFEDISKQAQESSTENRDDEVLDLLCKEIEKNMDR